MRVIVFILLFIFIFCSAALARPSKKSKNKYSNTSSYCTGQVILENAHSIPSVLNFSYRLGKSRVCGWDDFAGPQCWYRNTVHVNHHDFQKTWIDPDFAEAYFSSVYKDVPGYKSVRLFVDGTNSRVIVTLKNEKGDTFKNAYHPKPNIMFPSFTQINEFIPKVTNTCN